VRQSEFRKKIKEAGDTELETMLRQERENLYKMRQMIALKQLDNPHAMSGARKNVSRIIGEIAARKTTGGEGS
jgi:ribosomal protein L29